MKSKSSKTGFSRLRRRRDPRSNYAEALYKVDDATLDDLREGVATHEDAGRIARRVFGGAHPLTTGIEEWLGCARAALRARETPPPPPPAPLFDEY